MIRFAAVWMAFGLMAAVGAESTPLPDVKEVLRRLKERSEKVASDTNVYHYMRTNVIEMTEVDGKEKSRSEKVYRVTLKHGLPRAHLIAEDGKALGESDQKAKTEEEVRFKRKIAMERNPDYVKPKALVDEDLLKRFVFVVTGRTNVDGRTMLMVKFDPKTDAPTPKMIDKIINKVSGALWMDEEEAEIARLDVHLGASVKFWGGILGKLEKFDLTLVRKRSEFGAWFNQLTMGWVQVRTLFTTARMRIQEEAFGFGLGDGK